MTQERINGPLLGAGLTFLLCLVVYGLSISPTVTFWDAGEFLAASKVLGIPHPPGTPLFVFLSNTWAKLFPFGEYAFRVSLMIAMLSALTAALVYLILYEGLTYGLGSKRNKENWAPHAAALAGALVSAFAFTVWQNANESEVYMLAAVVVSATTLLALHWRRRRGTPGGTKCLLLAIYLLALSVGIHLLGLLVGPALIVFVWHQLRFRPHSDPAVRRTEVGHLAVIATVWLLLVAVGLGSDLMMLLAAVTVAAALAISWPRGAARFWIAAAFASVVGVSTYAFIYIRAGLAPPINVGDASTWEGLLALIAREQYPPRLPWDNPLFLSGPDNPGRSMDLVWLQVLNYLQYFDWQWSRGLAAVQGFLVWPRLPITVAYLTLGSLGACVVKSRDRSVFWLLLCTFLVTGPGLVAYMNFKPGFSIGYEQFPSFSQHEVRERDYFFLLSFQTWGMFVGVGIVAVCARIRAWLQAHDVRVAVRTAVAALPYGLAFLPFILNHAVADRSNGPGTRLAVDFAYDLLQSVEPYGILVTGGDNDTYPLWYAQEVLGVRRDVTVVVLPLSDTDWHIRQIRDRDVRPFDPAEAPWFADISPPTVPPPPHSLSDAQIASMRAMLMPQAFRYQAGVIDKTLEAGTPLYVRDQVLLRLIQESVGKRTVHFATSSGSDLVPMFRDSIVREGLTFRLYADRVPELSGFGAGFDGFPVDIERTDKLANEVYRYAGLFEADTNSLDPTERRIAANLGSMLLALGSAYDSVGDRQGALGSLERADHLMPGFGIREFIESVGIDASR